MDTVQTAFLIMVFVAVFLLAQGLIVPAFGESRLTRKRLNQRVAQMASAADRAAIASILREKYLKDLSAPERALEALPGMERLGRIIAQAGHAIPAYRLVMTGVLAGAAVTLLTWWAFRQPLPSLGAGIAMGAAPFVKVLRDRARRLARFEEQFPEAVDLMKRALRAGHPFNETLRLVSEEMDGPVAKEFGITFADLNYGNDLRRSLLGMLERVPSIMVMVLITSVLVQRETGGNLTEILDKIAAVVRARFRFQRRVQTLSAEGRLSAWVLALVPFGLFLVISVITPDYLPVLIEQPVGHRLITIAMVLMVIGIFWMRKIIRIRV